MHKPIPRQRDILRFTAIFFAFFAANPVTGKSRFEELNIEHKYEKVPFSSVYERDNTAYSQELAGDIHAKGVTNFAWVQDLPGDVTGLINAQNVAGYLHQTNGTTAPSKPTEIKAIPGVNNPGFDTARFSPEGVEADYAFVKYDRIAREINKSIPRKNGQPEPGPGNHTPAPMPKGRTDKPGKAKKPMPNTATSSGGGGGGAATSGKLPGKPAMTPAKEVGQSQVTPPVGSTEDTTGNASTDTNLTEDTPETPLTPTEQPQQSNTNWTWIIIAGVVIVAIIYRKHIIGKGAGNSKFGAAVGRFINKSGQIVGGKK